MEKWKSSISGTSLALIGLVLVVLSVFWIRGSDENTKGNPQVPNQVIGQGSDKNQPPSVESTKADHREVVAPTGAKEVEVGNSITSVLVPRLDGIIGIVVDEHNAPVANVPIEATGPKSMAYGVPQSLTTTSDTEGAFFFPVHAGVSFLLRAEQAPHGWGYVDRVFAGDAVVLTLSPGATLRVLAISASEVPMAGVAVNAQCIPLGADDPIWQPTQLTDAAGWVELSGAPKGYITISGRTPGKPLAWAGVSPLGTGTIEVELRFEEGISVSGKVLDRETGLGVSGVSVGNFEVGYAVSAADGSFQLNPAQASDSVFTIKATHKDYLPGIEFLKLASEPAHVQRNIYLERGPRASGKVLTETGQGMPGVEVRLYGLIRYPQMTGESHLEVATTNNEGLYRFGPMNPGTSYAALASEGEFRGVGFARPSKVDPEVRFDDIMLEPGATIRGMVILSPLHRGKMPKVHLDLESPFSTQGASSLALWKAQPSDSGAFAFSGIPTGSYSISLHWGSGSFDSNVTQFAHLAPGEERTLANFDLTGTNQLTLAGEVSDSHGERIKGIWVTAMLGKQAISRCPTDDSGAFGFDLEGQGPWHLLVEDRQARYETVLAGPFSSGDSHIAISIAPLVTNFTLEGYVVDQNGDPVTEAFIALRDPDSGLRYGKLGIPDTNGRFKIANLLERTYTLEVVDFEGLYASYQQAGIVPGTEITVVLEKR